MTNDQDQQRLKENKYIIRQKKENEKTKGKKCGFEYI